MLPYLYLMTRMIFKWLLVGVWGKESSITLHVNIFIFLFPIYREIQWKIFYMNVKLMLIILLEGLFLDFRY